MNTVVRNVTLVVKATDDADADGIIAERMNAWFCEPNEIQADGYPRGTLLLWTGPRQYAVHRSPE